MEKILRILFLGVLILNPFACYANVSEDKINEISLSESSDVVKVNEKLAEGKILSSEQVIPDENYKDEKAPVLNTPVVEDIKKSSSSKKINLKAVIFDPNAEFDAEAKEENREMTKLEEAQYNIHEALHGEVSKLSTKGLLADKMKMTFEKGPIDNISPWIDYNGYFSNIWNGPDYQNTLYSINFADVGFNINMKDNRNFVRLMFSPVKTYPGKNYFQGFFADNYYTRKIGKNNTLLIGHTWVPLGLEGKESPLVWQFFNRSQMSLKYSSVRALGTKVMGNYKYADYHVGLYSSGRGFNDWFPGPEFAGWVEFKPLANLDEKKYGKLIVAAGMDAGNAEGRFTVGTGAISYEYKRLKAITEFGIADGSNGATGYTDKRSKGFNGTLSYRVTPRFQALARYDQFDPNTNKANDMKREYSVGFNYFIKDYAARLMFNYVMYTMENGTYGSKILVGTQIVL